MACRVRIWRVGKWAGAVVMAAVALTWLYSVSMPWWTVYGEVGLRRPQNIVSLDGGVLNWLHADAPLLEDCDGGWYRHPFYEDRSFRERYGVTVPVARRVASGNVGVWYVTAPLWFVLLVVAVPTGGLWYFAQRHIALGHCLRCGYDLTKNESGRCPECGLVCASIEQRDGSRFRRPSGAE